MFIKDRFACFLEGTSLASMRQSTRFWALALGVALPLVSAILFPTYFTRMVSQQYETLRLLEVPYVVLEVAFFLWAGRHGFQLSAAIKALPRDIKVAGGVFVFALFASSFFIAKDISYALTHSLLWLVHVIFALSALHFFKEKPVVDGDGYMSWHAIGLAILAVYTAWWFSFPPPINELPFREIVLKGAVPSFINVRHFGAWTGAIAAGFAIRILYGKADKGMPPARVFYVLAAGLTVWSGTRAAILAMLAVTLVFIFSLKQLPSFSRILWAILLTAIACAAAYALLVDDQDFHLFVAREMGSAQEVAGTRLYLWSRTIELWLQSPILGLGTGSIFWEFGPNDTPTQPHNFLLQFLISWGVVGAAAALWILARVIRAAHHKAMGAPSSYALLGFLYGLLFQSILEGMLHYPRFIISIIVLAAMLFHFRNGDYRAQGGQAL